MSARPDRCYGSEHYAVHAAGCRPGRPLCRWQRKQSAKYAPCHCPAFHFPHRAGSCEARLKALIEEQANAAMMTWPIDARMAGRESTTMGTTTTTSKTTTEPKTAKPAAAPAPTPAPVAVAFDAMADAEANRWNLATFRTRKGALVVIHTEDNRGKLGQGIAPTIPEAYKIARAEALRSDPVATKKNENRPAKANETF